MSIHIRTGVLVPLILSFHCLAYILRRNDNIKKRLDQVIEPVLNCLYATVYDKLFIGLRKSLTQAYAKN